MYILSVQQTFFERKEMLDPRVAYFPGTWYRADRAERWPMIEAGLTSRELVLLAISNTKQS